MGRPTGRREDTGFCDKVFFDPSHSRPHTRAIPKFKVPTNLCADSCQAIKPKVQRELKLSTLIKLSQDDLQELRWGHGLLERARKTRKDFASSFTDGGSPTRSDKETTRSRQAPECSPEKRAKTPSHLTNFASMFGDEEAPESEMRPILRSAQSLATIMATAWHSEQGHSLASNPGGTTKSCSTALEKEHARGVAIRKALQTVASTVPTSNSVFERPRLKHAQGTPVYYGSSIALQAHHGGYLALDSRGRASASTPHLTPPALFTIWNLANLGDTGLVRYGDQIWLQCSRYEVLGTSGLQEDYEASWNDLLKECSDAVSRYDKYDTPDWEAYAAIANKERAIAAATAATLARSSTQRIAPPSEQAREAVGRLCAIHCSGAGFANAKHTGRWVVVNSCAPYTKIGTNVSHLDEVAFEQEWLYVASHCPNIAELHASRTNTSRVVQKMRYASHDGTENRDTESITEEKQGNCASSVERDCTWTLHVVDPPATSNDEQRRLKCAMNARRQLARSSRLMKRTQDAILRMRREQKADSKPFANESLGRIAERRKHFDEYIEAEFYACGRKGWISKARGRSAWGKLKHSASEDSSPDAKKLSLTSAVGERDQDLAETMKHSNARDRETRLRTMKLAYDACAHRGVGTLRAFASADRATAQALVRRNRAVAVLQTWARARLRHRWPWKLARIDRDLEREIKAGKAHHPPKGECPSDETSSLSKKPSPKAVPARSLTNSSARLRASVAAALVISDGVEGKARYPEQPRRHRPASAPSSRQSTISVLDSSRSDHPSSPSPEILALTEHAIVESELSIAEGERFVAYCRPKRRPAWNSSSRGSNKSNTSTIIARARRRRPATASR